MSAYNALCLLVILVFCQEIYSHKYRLCVVDSRREFKKTNRNCPILDKADSPVQCVLGIDRLDCLRKIWKRKADFAVFTPEDLVAASNTGNELLVTNELRYDKEAAFEYEVVAVINDDSGIKGIHDLVDKRFCHPGFGDEAEFTRILANFLEASIVPQTCNRFQTLTENRISASSNFFKAACKAGPWVNDPFLDKTLKDKYPKLCELCDNGRCDKEDKYWGRRGALYCLTDGMGDISWTRLDDVHSHFGLSSPAVLPPDGYSFLCQDGTTRPVNSTNPCVWVVKPWPVIATNRTSAAVVQTYISSVNHDEAGSWKNALLNLLETYHVEVKTLETTEAIENYLERATGFLSANSFTGCHPPRTVRICTTSNIENAKCGWMREAAAVHGVMPDIDCLKADNTTHCMQAITMDAADVVMVPPDLVGLARREYDFATLFYETVRDEDKYITVVVVKSGSRIKKIADLKGAKACFPKYDGIAWNSALHSLNKRGLLATCPLNQSMAEFFGESCVPGVPKEYEGTLGMLCKGNTFDGEYGALKCLVDGGGDVAIISQNSLLEYLQDQQQNQDKLKMSDFRIICEKSAEDCQLTWSPIGQAMVSKKNSNVWFRDTLDVFLQLDTLFGQEFNTPTAPFTMFGLYDGKPNVLFHDKTQRLRNVPRVKDTDKMLRPYEDIFQKKERCKLSGSHRLLPSIAGLLILLSFLLCQI